MRAHTHEGSQLPANAQTQSSCVFSVCSPTHPLRPSTPNLHPSSLHSQHSRHWGYGACHILNKATEWTPRRALLQTICLQTSIVCQQTLTLTFSMHPCRLSEPSSTQTNLREASIYGLFFFFTLYDDLRSTKGRFWSLQCLVVQQCLIIIIQISVLVRIHED